MTDKSMVPPMWLIDACLQEKGPTQATLCPDCLHPMGEHIGDSDGLLCSHEGCTCDRLPLGG